MNLRVRADYLYRVAILADVVAALQEVEPSPRARAGRDARRARAELHGDEARLA